MSLRPVHATETFSDKLAPEDRAAFLDAVLEGIQDGVLVAQDERIIEVNDAFCRMLGFEREELIGAKLPFPFFPPEDIKRIHGLLQRLREVGAGEHEMTLMRKDGSRIPVLLSAGTVESSGRYMGRVITIRDISARRQREARLAELAARDELTGLFNKRSFLVTLAGEVARARRHGRSLSLAILDLDGFKRINDAGGHQLGDRVLAEAAGRLSALVRTGEHMARVGGDEFGWILPDADTDGAMAAIQRARRAIAGEPFLRGTGFLTLSAGVCETDGSADANELYRRADRALYAAKASGGDNIQIY